MHGGLEMTPGSARPGERIYQFKTFKLYKYRQNICVVDIKAVAADRGAKVMSKKGPVSDLPIQTLHFKVASHVCGLFSYCFAISIAKNKPGTCTSYSCSVWSAGVTQTALIVHKLEEE